jgi:uncharacterized protein YkwD
MARSSAALAAAILAILAASATPSALAKSSSARHKGACASAAGKPAKQGTRSFRNSSCPKGHTHRHKGSSKHHATHRLFFKAKNGQCRDSGLSPGPSDVEAVRAATLCLVNRERGAHGEPALHWNNHLVKAAQAHTESMAFGNYFEHVGPGGETPLSRMRHDGYIYSSRLGYEVGENIGWGSLWLGTPKAVVAAWMASPGHRANILDRHFRDTGIGVSPHLGSLAHGQSGGIYTQDFGVIVTG